MQAIFESKWDMSSCSAECRIRTQGLRQQIARRRNARRKTDWAIEGQVKNLDSTARPYDQRAFSPLDPLPGFRTWLWRCTCLLLISISAQASDIRIGRGHVVFSAECRIRSSAELLYKELHIMRSDNIDTYINGNLCINIVKEMFQNYYFLPSLKTKILVSIVGNFDESLGV